jgi:hypothetical protein
MDSLLSAILCITFFLMVMVISSSSLTLKFGDFKKNIPNIFYELDPVFLTKNLSLNGEFVNISD